MNAKVGNVAPGQTQIIKNNPFTIWKGIYEWVSTYVMNEKNAEWISQKVQNDLDAVDLTTALTVDWADKGQYWICVGKKVWVLNYRTQTWHILDLPDTPTCFCLVEQDLYFGTTAGQIMAFDEEYSTFNGAEIVDSWEMGYFNFGVEWLQKFVQRLFVSILPYTTTKINLYIKTDRNANYVLAKTISYGLSSFETWDFSGTDVTGYETIGFSFETNYSPQPFKIKVRAKKIDYLKVKITNNSQFPATVLSITLPTRMGAEIKNRG